MFRIFIYGRNIFYGRNIVSSSTKVLKMFCAWRNSTCFFALQKYFCETKYLCYMYPEVTSIKETSSQWISVYPLYLRLKKAISDLDFFQSRVNVCFLFAQLYKLANSLFWDKKFLHQKHDAYQKRKYPSVGIQNFSEMPNVAVSIRN